MCSVLAVVLERLPAAFLCSNFSSAALVICAVIEQHQDEVWPAFSRSTAF